LITLSFNNNLVLFICLYSHSTLSHGFA